MSREQPGDAGCGEEFSALMDGELDAAAVARACRAWRDDAPAREIWHSYHLIGDVMRSEDLSSTAPGDAAFLRGVRERLAREPVVVAPQPVRAAPTAAAAGRTRGRGWRRPAAVAAGFVAVAGVLVITRAPAPVVVEQVATVPLAASAVVPVASVEPVGDPPAMVANGKLIRDARLDRYLDAHQQFAGSSALGVPSSFLRRATTDASSR